MCWYHKPGIMKPRSFLISALKIFLGDPDLMYYWVRRWESFLAETKYSVTLSLHLSGPPTFDLKEDIPRCEIWVKKKGSGGGGKSKNTQVNFPYFKY